MPKVADSSAPISPSSGPISVAVNEYVAARRLGLSVDTLRRDRRLGHLGIPFIKIGSGKHSTVRYDLVDLDGYVAARKRRTLPQAPQPPVYEPPVAEPAAEMPATPVELRAHEPEPPAPRRPSPPRTPWEALAETVLAEPEEEEPFPADRAAPRRQGSGYWGH
jgi:hypothetical protein